MTGPAAPTFMNLFEGRFRRLAKSRQVSMAYDMVKQTIDAPNSPFKTVERCKTKRENCARHTGASTALKGIWTLDAYIIAHYEISTEWQL